MRTKAWYVVLLVVLHGLVAHALVHPTHPVNVILVGWDGAQRGHVMEALGQGELPNLQRLIAKGNLIRINIEGVTDTKAGWSQILTGYYPEVTGVYSNSEFQPVPVGMSIFERLEAHFGPKRFVTAAVIGKKYHCGDDRAPFKIPIDPNDPNEPNQPGDDKGGGVRIVVEDGVTYKVFPGAPYYHMSQVADVWEYGLILDSMVGTRALALLDTYRYQPFFFFVHFASVDSNGHLHGENSQQYNDALISNDQWTGRIMDKLERLGLANKTLIYVTADHGFDENRQSHSFAPYVFLATNDMKIWRDGRRQDVAPTILETFGLNTAMMEPPLNGISLTKPDNRPFVPITKDRRPNAGQ